MAAEKAGGVKIEEQSRASPKPPSSGGDMPKSSVPTLIAMAVVTAILYVGQDVFLPLAMALLLTFALAPIVSFLRRQSLPKLPAVIVTVALAFLAIALFSFIVATQVASLAQNIPTYQSNILEKVRSLREMGAGGGIIDRLSGAVERVGAELEDSVDVDDTPEDLEREPLPVEIVQQQSPIETLRQVIVPLISPFATAGLTIVVVIFMLLEREDLRDRFIRLVGSGDLHRTTEALQDAGKRVGRYLLMQLVINTIYAVPIAIGLWILGIPNAPLWGLLTLVLRFVPYIGPAIGMLLPLLLALAVAPGWSLVLWTAALFLFMELISNNILEPWLYGSRTGLSPLAIIVAAIFWTWLWGPLGLVLSTPLTVCLVVLGRHVPQFEFLDVLFGNEPVLEPHARLYQRLLAGDPDEATDHAEEFLEEEYLVDFYDEIGIPALLLGEQDRKRGVLREEQRARFAQSVHTMIVNLEDIADEEENEEEDEAQAEESRGSETEEGEEPELPDGTGKVLVCLGGRTDIDDAAAAMLAQVVKVQGASASVMSHDAIGPRAMGGLKESAVDTVIVAFLNAQSSAHARLMVRRLKRTKSKLRVGLFVPTLEDTGRLPIKAEDFNADFIALSVREAVTAGLADTKPVPLKAVYKRLSPRGKRAGKAKATAAS